MLSPSRRWRYTKYRNKKSRLNRGQIYALMEAAQHFITQYSSFHILLYAANFMLYLQSNLHENLSFFNRENDAI